MEGNAKTEDLQRGQQEAGHLLPPDAGLSESHKQLSENGILSTYVATEFGSGVLKSVHSVQVCEKVCEPNGNKDECIEDLEPHLDSHWSFAIALASFLAQAILGGHVYTTGIFYTVFREQFPEAREVAVSWLCSMPITLWFVGSPLGSALSNRYGCRTASITGGFLASTGLTLCYFTNNFYLIFLFYGVVAGFGNGIHYVGFVASVSRYFKKFRTVANIITTIGVTFGMALYATLVPMLNDAFSWQGTLLILGGISFNLCSLACILFPIKHSTPMPKKKIMNFSLLKDKHFLLFDIQCILCNLSSGVIFLHLPALIISNGISFSVSSLSLTIYGVSNCVAKVIYSVIGYMFAPDCSAIYVSSLTVYGCALILLATYPTHMWVICFSAILGFTYSVTGGYLVEVILSLVGPENIADGLAFGQVGKAVGSLLCGPLAGLLYESSESYQTSFFAGGVIMLLGCVLMLPVARQMRKNNRLSRESETAIDFEEENDCEIGADLCVNSNKKMENILS
ncbi:monocarboxylate transporter 13-like [Mya arenaria]|uniref:monocarboxylate transporter 13-like n=1 Tax=Mya arenaria TaxID=6604 RepID=UPI0022E846CF|nr:monocarboxylate transporter 13-like [Mya arenaria]